MSVLLFVACVLASTPLCALTAHVPDRFSVPKSENTTAALGPQLQSSPAKQFFQLQARSNSKCLKLTSTNGIYVPCTDHSSTIFFLNGDNADNHNIVILGTSQCLDREHCHSSSSNLRFSPCDHCGAIHWDIRSDGSLREDGGRNCIRSDSSTQASVHHCSDGFEAFNIVPLGNRFRIKSVRHGDCVNGGTFANCDCAATFYITGTPRFYSIRLYNAGNTCLDREHCHSSTSNLRYSDCGHCGAIHWSIEGSAFGEDEMKNCITRTETKVTYVRHCSDGHEELSYEIMPPPSAGVEEQQATLTRHFRDPNINQYLSLNLRQGCRGIKLFRYSRDGTLEVEVVHFLPSNQVFFSGQYTIQYMVTHIHTNIGFASYYTSEYILELLATDPSHVLTINIRYGGVGAAGVNHNRNDGLNSEFLTNTGPGAGLPLPPIYHQRTVQAIFDGFGYATNNWDHYSDSVHPGTTGAQIFISISYTYYVTLYWSYNPNGCNRVVQEALL